MSTRIIGNRPNHYIGGQYNSPWGAGEGIFSLPKETMTKIFNELDPASQTAASFTARAFKEIHPPLKKDLPNFCVDALQAGHLELIQWGIINKYRSDQVIVNAMRAGNFDLLNLLKSIKSFRGWINVHDALNAIENGRLDVLQWLCKNAPEILCSDLFERAMIKGNVEILNWLKAKGVPTHCNMFDVRYINAYPAFRTWLYANYDLETKQPK